MKFAFEKSPRPSAVSESDWSQWGWQLRHSLKSLSDFQTYFQLTEAEQIAFHSGKELFNIRTTPYYARLCGSDAQDPLRRILMPHKQELFTNEKDEFDPLGERKNSPVKRLIHRYPDRVLFLVTDVCSVYCRYCTRKHFTGGEQAFIPAQEFSQAIDYIRKHTGIREVILSGGDPLTLSNTLLDRVLCEIRAIPHVEIVRIGSRMPVVCPMRIDAELVSVISKYHPVYLMTHFNHPRELSFEAAQGLLQLVNAGIPVFNQMVLLNGVNNHPAIVQALSRRLLYLRVKPYYMFQCDPSVGTDHLRTSVEESLQIQKELWGNLSGLAMPQLSLDIPKGGGKVSLVPDFEVERSSSKRRYIGWDGVDAEYHNPDPQHHRLPMDVGLYQAEWDELKAAKFPLANWDFSLQAKNLDI